MSDSFAIILHSHRILGPLLNAVIINQVEGRDYYTVSDRLSVANLKKYENSLYPWQIKLVKTIEEYSDNQLLKIFSKKKISAQEFLAGLNLEIQEKYIRPYIEKRILRCLELISGTDVPFFLKKQLNNLYDSDRLFLTDETSAVVFNFNYNDEGIRYNLSVNYLNDYINLTGKKGFILINDPCRLVLENKIFQFDDIDGKKLLPFFNKSFIHVRPETAKKFFEAFVKPVIRKYEVKAEGFIINNINIKPLPVLSLEPSIDGLPVLMLYFKYGEKGICYAGKKTEFAVSMVSSEQGIEFRRMIRNLNYENRIISSLLEMGLVNFDLSSFTPIGIKRKDNILIIYDIVNWININSEALKKHGIETEHRHPTNRFYLNKVELKLNVNENSNDWFDIHAIVQFEDFEIPFIRFRTNIINGIREYRLPDGRLAVIPEEWFSRFIELFTFSRENNEVLQLDRQHFTLLDKCITEPDSTYASRIRTWLNTDIREEKEVPAGIKASLRDYQKKGFSWMWQLYQNGFGACLADDMGLGKTLQTITLILQAINEEKLRQYGPATSNIERQLTIFDTPAGGAVKTMPSLIIVPSSLVNNWINEVTRFAPEIRAVYYGGQNRKPFSEYYRNYDIIITSYGHIRSDPEAFNSYEFLFVVLDESQMIKNHHSKTYKAVISLSTTNKVVLTGTPIENSLTDLWSQMNFLNPGLLGSFNFFKSQFAIPIEKAKNKKQSDVLKTLISPFIMRRTKTDVAPELPILSRQVIYCDMPESHLTFYEREKSKVRNLILNNIKNQSDEKAAILILQSLTRLRQIANHPVLVEESYKGESGKYEAVIDNIRNLVNEGHKALVFSSFVKHIKLFTDFCNEENINYSLLTGDLSKKKREEAIEIFRKDSATPLFFISIKAGGFGLNLTEADYVFILDPWWNPAVEEQALSRAHRIGQSKNVFVHRFVSKDTLEEKIHNLQNKKSRLSEYFINTNNPLDLSDRQDLLNMIE